MLLADVYKRQQSLVDKNAAILIKDQDAKANLVPEALRLLNSAEARQKLSDNISKLALRDSAKVIAEQVLSLIKN